MAGDASERTNRFKEAAVILADDAVQIAGKLRKMINGGEYERAQGLAGTLQRTARDAKWLMQRQPKE